ncbi:hypothetical protein CKAN_02401900 [Cinnamomum micranthum f. kanehirae]|uniref:Uncharacterized protein n=1 Tax=Cinnamomum micranthum f. kanehirae TaxID=337451 RepID=A0A3S3NLS8_9MAGN|nr:hypothetical protein CKAN_02401900 [Cinnamomum micranthum f. kanehirae]
MNKKTLYFIENLPSSSQTKTRLTSQSQTQMKQLPKRLLSFTPKRRNEKKKKKKGEISTLPNYGISPVFPYLPKVMSSFELFGTLQCDDYLLPWTKC